MFSHDAEGICYLIEQTKTDLVSVIFGISFLQGITCKGELYFMCHLLSKAQQIPCHLEQMYNQYLGVKGGTVLKQVQAGLQPAHVWFLACPQSVVCLCPTARLVITSGGMWTPYDLLNKIYIQLLYGSYSWYH